MLPYPQRWVTSPGTPARRQSTHTRRRMMPAKKTPKWTPPELAALRARIRDAMAEQGLSPEALAKRIDRKVETVKLYLADPAYRTQRQPSADFLARGQFGGCPFG